MSALTSAPSSLLQAIDEAFERSSWHGPNLKGCLRGVSARLAAWRPAADRHNIWELAVHAAYWKYVVRRRLTGEKRGSFSLKGSNWLRRPSDDDSEDAWRRDLRVLFEEHRSLRQVLADLEPRLADGGLTSLESSKLRPEAALRMIRGIAAHDLYHAGQITLMKRLAPYH